MAPIARRLLSRVPFAPHDVSLRVYHSTAFSSISASPTTDEVERSSLLRQALVKQSPPTLCSRKLQWNSCSFIGTIATPLKTYRKLDRCGVYTVLDVNACSSPSNHSHTSSFRLLLELWDKLAETALRNLEKKDLIYAWGCLSSYNKIGDSGKEEVSQKLVVRKLNYVRRHDEFLTSNGLSNVNEDHNKVATCTQQDSGSEIVDRLQLWQIFFASPHEWWDNRQLKVTSPQRWPDFRHKHTHESLTLRKDDPPWVRRQLELHDSKMLKTSSANFGDWSSSFSSSNFEK